MRGFFQVLLAFIFVIFFIPALAAEVAETVTVEGVVRDAGENNVLPGATVEFSDPGTERVVTFAVAGENGTYRIAGIAAGRYDVTVRFVGYRPYIRKDVSLSGFHGGLDFCLEEDAILMDGVVVRAESESAVLQKMAYNVQSMETASLVATTADMAGAIDRISGIRIREEGGVGSDVGIMLNGFSGKHVKVFIDGVPMDGIGSAFGLNNIPAGVAKRIDVYKGVVPVWLGGDAIGGAINIITDRQSGMRTGASYSYGSFNTHKSSVYAEYTSASGFYTYVNLYQNYSDNDYMVDARILNLETGVYEPGTRRVRRFHAMYHNEAIMAKAGVVGKKFADRLVFGVVLGNEYKQIQNASDMNFVYGERYNTANTLLPSVSYDKFVPVMEGLSIGFNANYNLGSSYSNDTSNRRYNWLGEWKEKSSNASPGEMSYMKYHYRDRNGSANLKLSFSPVSGHSFDFSSTVSVFSRKGYNEVAPDPADDYPQESVKDVSGLSYRYVFRDNLDISVFGKNYLNYLKAYIDPDGGTDYALYTNLASYFGGGMAVSYFVIPEMQLKASYEHTYRLPTSRELFGSGDGLEVGSSTLKPESGENFNLGISYTPFDTGNHYFNADVTAMYRNIRNYIRRTVNQTQGTATSQNEGRVRSIGADVNLRYEYRDMFFAGISFSYYDMRNLSRYKSGTSVPSTTYMDRIPNQPYMYGNADLGCRFRNLVFRNTSLDIRYVLNYVHEFYFDWPSYGGVTVPTQFSSDIVVSCSMRWGKHDFTLSLEGRNLFDARLYDNFSLQKPGRSLSVKLVYNFVK